VPTPTLHQAVREVRTGVRRTQGAPACGKAALMTDDLRRLLELLDRTPLGLRDRALLLLGFAGRSALRSLSGSTGAACGRNNAVDKLSLEGEASRARTIESGDDPLACSPSP
jgi:site-specific recombinase XerC